MSLFLNLMQYKIIWKEKDTLKSINPITLNTAMMKQHELIEKGIPKEDIGIYKIGGRN